MYHKVPVISTDVGGIPEAIEHNINGLLSPKHNPSALANNIKTLMKNNELQKSFVAISHDKLHKKFTTFTMAQKTLEIYKTILEHG